MNYSILNKLLLLTLLSVSPLVMADSNKLGLIPVPKKIEFTKGTLFLDSEASLSISEGVDLEFAQMCADLLRQPTGWAIPVNKNGVISLILDQTKQIAEEGYLLKVTTKKATITASTQKGLFYGFQTLRQLMPVESFATKKSNNMKWQIPTVNIEDAPRFSWRGILVDVSRKFQSKETIIKLLDTMAACKLNVFHWHLTDDQGWRLEIKKYPLLTQLSKQFYTQEEICEIIKYAAMRNIMIIPEIDIPGHSAAAAQAYPQLRCRVADGSKSDKGNTYCPGEKFCYQFLNDVLKEVSELFPAPYIHLGADEVSRGNWRQCPDCQKLIKEKKLKGLHGLEGYFVQRMIKSVQNLGKKAITWDEAFNDHCDKELVIMSWRGVEPGMKAAEKGHKVILSPVSSLYFDRTSSRSKHQKHGYSINTVTLNQAYFFEGRSPLLAKDAHKNILGAQGCIWGEKIKSDKHVMRQAMMRGCALAEATWSGAEKRNWNSFLKRAKIHSKRLDAMDVAYFWEPMSNAIELAQLKPGAITTANGTIEIDVSKYVKSNGLYEFMFHRYHGEGSYQVTETILLKNGREVSKDTHTHKVTIDSRRPTQFYHLWVRNFKTGAKYTLSIKANNEKSDQFTGAVMLVPPLKKEEYSEWAKPESGANGQKYKAPDME